MRVPFVFAAALCAAPISAQGHVSPTDYGAVEGSNSSTYPLGFYSTSTTSGARQVNLLQVHDDVPAMLIGSIAFRRDGAETRFYPIPSYRVELQIDMSTAATTATTISATYAQNHGTDQVAVLPRSWVSLPATVSANFAPEPFSYAIAFTTPFNHSGAGLCYQVRVFDSDLQTRFGTGNYFDRAYQSGDGSSGTATGFGTYYGWGCRGSFSYSTPAYAYLNASVDLATSEIDWYTYHYYLSPAGSNTVMLMGGLRLEIDLGFLGATGCLLSNEASLILPMGQSDYRGYSRFPASGSATLPWDNTLGGATLTVQGLSLDPAANAAGIVTTRAYQRVLPIVYAGGLPAAQVYRTGTTALSNPDGTVTTSYANVTLFQ